MAARSENAESENGSTGLPDFGDSIDPLTFEQILEMDDDEDERDFSKSIVFGFFEQAEATFKKMEVELQNRNLTSLSELGHFLKGSSATLGLTKVKDSCEKIQHYGALKDDSGNSRAWSEDEFLNRIRATLEVVKVEYKEAEQILRKFYRDSDARA